LVTDSLDGLADLGPEFMVAGALLTLGADLFGGPSEFSLEMKMLKHIS